MKRCLIRKFKSLFLAFSTALCLLTMAASRSDADPAMFTDGSDGSNWPSYGGTYREWQYSPLAQINRENVEHLGLAWFVDLPPGTAVGTPLAIDGTVFITSGLSVLRAIDAASGRVLWTYDPQVARVAGQKLRAGWGARGIAYWNGKVYVGTMDGRLVAVVAQSGALA